MKKMKTKKPETPLETNKQTQKTSRLKSSEVKGVMVKKSFQRENGI